jgi:hypothetical protein
MRQPAWSLTRASAAAAALFLLASTAGAGAQTPHRSHLNGDQLLAHATAAPHLRSYAVPVTFAVHLHKPIGLRSQVQGMAYFESPAQAALSITKATGIVGGFFKGAYNLDMVPQAWPQKYHVLAVTPSVAGGTPVFVLRAEPRGPAADITQVVFTLTRPALQPISAEWDYTDASSIRLNYVNEKVGPYTLPESATIAVDKPHYKLDADATYGSYSLNAPVLASVFEDAK